MDVVQPAQDKIPRACVECLVEDYIDPVREKAPVMVSLLTPIPVMLLALVEATLRVALAVITVVACPFLLGFAMCDFFFAERGLTLYVENLENIERCLTVFLETLPCEIGSLYSYCSKGDIPFLSSKPPEGSGREVTHINPMNLQKSPTVQRSAVTITGREPGKGLESYITVKPTRIFGVRPTYRVRFDLSTEVESPKDSQAPQTPTQRLEIPSEYASESELAIAAKQELLSFTQAAANLSVATIASEVFAEKAAEAKAEYEALAASGADPLRVRIAQVKYSVLAEQAAEEAREVEAFDRAYAKPRVEAVEGVPNQYGIYFI